MEGETAPLYKEAERRGGEAREPSDLEGGPEVRALGAEGSRVQGSCTWESFQGVSCGFLSPHLACALSSRPYCMGFLRLP